MVNKGYCKKDEAYKCMPSKCRDFDCTEARIYLARESAKELEKMLKDPKLIRECEETYRKNQQIDLSWFEEYNI